MVDKNMLLVNMIEKFPCLYNPNLIEYTKKDATDKAWNEVACHTQLTVGECKEKWKNLRYGLLRSLKPHPDGTIKKKYYLHDEMEFVLPYIKYSKPIGVVATPLEEDTDEEINANVVDNGGSPLPVLHQQYFELDYNPIDLPPMKKRARISTQRQPQQKTVNYIDDSPDNPRRLYLLSLLPEVNELTEEQMKIFRRKILELLDDIVGSSPSQYDIIQWRRQTSQDVDTHKNPINEGVKTEPL